MGNYWLLKSEPNTYSIWDLREAPEATDCWDGVRNFQARNFLRQMQVGDRAFFYHSVVRPLGIYGIVEVVRPAYPDPTQFEPESKYYDPKATPSTPRWSAVDVRLLEFFEEPVTLDRLKACPELANLEVTRKGSRLSVQPVGAEEWDFIVRKLASSPGK